MKPTLEQLKYPIGKFVIPKSISEEDIKDAFKILRSFPVDISNRVTPLLDKQLDYQYRPGGWNVREVVHHCADSHMNAIIRFKLALTEQKPTIKPYFEDRWATLIDYKSYNLEASLIIIKGVHQKLTNILSNLDSRDYSRTFKHPAHDQVFRIDQATLMYAWHSRRHLAHIDQALEHKGTFEI